jgi:Zn-dependent protease
MLETIVFIVILLFSVILHECAHGLAALWCGDPTAKEQGRLTLNPLSHIDLFGTVILPVALMILRSLGSPLLPIGYAKPVPISYNRLRNPKRDMLFVGLAGPLTNFAIASAAAGGFHASEGILSEGIRSVFIIVVIINLLLAFFNLTPIPPLDGSRVVFSLLPDSLAYQYAKLERFGMIIVLAILSAGFFNVIADLTIMGAKFLGITFHV